MRDPAFLAASSSERGVWLSVMAYACHIECGGVLAGAASWKDRQWQVTCGVSLREVCKSRSLLQESGGNILVIGYPIQKEKQVKQARSVARDGAISRWNNEKQKSDAMPSPMPVGMPSAMPTGNAEGKGRERKGREGNAPACGPEIQDDQDLFDSPPNSNSKSNPNTLVPPPPLPQVNARDLLASCSRWLDYFRGSESGRQEAEDALAGALDLYPASMVQDAIRESFLARKNKISVKDLLEVIYDYKSRLPEPVKPDCPLRIRTKRMLAAHGLAGWQAKTGRADETEGAILGAVEIAPEWLTEILDEHFPEVAP